MPARGYPIDIDVIILFELARGSGIRPKIWQRACARMKENGYKLHSGAWYPAMERLYRDGLVAWTMENVFFRPGRSRFAKVFALTEKGTQEARRLSAIIRNLTLSPEASV